MKEHPRAAVVIAAFEAEDHLAGAVESALRQTVRGLEVVVVDDGSTDRTAEVAASLARGDDRLTVVRRRNGGPGAARNEGAGGCAAPFLCFLDADDALPPGRLEAQLSVLAARPGLAMVYGPVVEVPAGGAAPARPFPLEEDGDALALALMEGADRGVPIHAALVRRTAFDAVGGFREIRPLVEDLDLWTRMALSGLAFAHEDAPPVTYNRREGSRSGRTGEVALGQLAVLEFLASRLPASPPDRRERVLRKTRHRTLSLAEILFAAGRRAEARTLALRSLRWGRRPGEWMESIAWTARPGRRP